MRLLYLVGNGFDLAYGLRTSTHEIVSAWANHIKKERLYEEFPGLEEMTEAFQKEAKWSGFELALGALLNENVSEDVLEFQDLFGEFLGAYLENEQKRVSDEIVSKNSFGLQSSAIDFMNGLKPLQKKVLEDNWGSRLSERHTLGAISFNYTNIFERTLIADQFPPGIGSFEGVIYPHSKLGEPIIFGLDNEDQLGLEGTEGSDELKALMIKSNAIRECGSLSDVQALELLARADIILIFGMSLGLTDARWWREICDWLETGSDRFCIVYDHGLTSEIARSARRYRTRVSAVRSELVKNAGKGDDKVSVERILVVPSISGLKIEAPLSKEGPDGQNGSYDASAS